MNTRASSCVIPMRRTRLRTALAPRPSLSRDLECDLVVRKTRAENKGASDHVRACSSVNREMPVWMNSAGCSASRVDRDPVISTRFSGTIGGPPSIGSPAPLRIRPSMSRDTFSLIVCRGILRSIAVYAAVPRTLHHDNVFDESRT